jgi:hypothetical protein
VAAHVGGLMTVGRYRSIHKSVQRSSLLIVERVLKFYCRNGRDEPRN